MQVTFLPVEGIVKKIEVYVDGSLYRTVIAQGFRKVFKSSREFSAIHEIDDWFDTVEYDVAKAYVIKLLSKRSYPKEVLERKLHERKFSKKNSQKLINFCLDRGFIDNTEWIKCFIFAQLRKGYGPKVILMKLFQKGINSDQASSLISKLVSTSEQKKSISHFLHKNSGKEKEKLFASLQRKGFSFSLIHETYTELN